MTRTERDGDQARNRRSTLTPAEAQEYAATIAAMDDGAFEDEVVAVTDAAARWPVYNRYDARAAVLQAEARRRPGGRAIYDRGHARMRAGVMVERALEQQLRALGGTR